MRRAAYLSFALAWLALIAFPGRAATLSGAAPSAASPRAPAPTRAAAAGEASWRAGETKSAPSRSDLAEYRGYVQVFTHAAITVRDPKNRYALRTFSYSPALRRELLNRHLNYDQPVRVTYRKQDQVAVRIRAHWQAGG